MDEKNIIIKQSYFTNIQTAINSINEFFSSQFKTKNFPVLDEGLDIDPTVERILTRLNAVDSSWVFDENKYQDMLNLINGELEKIDPEGGVYETLMDSNNETLIQAVDSYVGFKWLNLIADNFDAFTTFINGIYTFEIFYKPSGYTPVLNIFDQPISFDEVPSLDLDDKVFDVNAYVDGIFKNGDISLPEELTEESEIERISTRQDLDGYEIMVDDSVQEAAEINYFENDKPANMKYSESQKKFLISEEFKKAVDELIAGLRKCDSTDDLLKFFGDSTVIPKLVDRMSRTVIPFILVKVLTNPKKTVLDFSGKLKKYTDSYASILSQNVGARRFENYDLFSTFKSDKEGTIKFVEDFCKLNLVNNTDASIANNTLLTIFNIFDSRIYLDLAYNNAPESIKSEKIEDAFVKEIRGRINKNSRTQTAYTEEAPKETTDTGESTTVEPETTEAVTEYVSKELKKFGDMTPRDMRFCDQFGALLLKEIDTIEDRMYNEHVSPILIDEYIGESYDFRLGDDIIMEANITKRREALQSAIASFLEECEKIVEMDKKHTWNNNTFARQFRTTAGMMFPRSFFPFLLPIPVANVTGSSEQHTNIKQSHKWIKKALKGKAGQFTNEQLRTMNNLKDLVDDMWGTVKWFWINPINWSKEVNIGHNTRIQGRVKSMARIAKDIVALKPKLDFVLNDDKFVNEFAFMEQYSEEVIMEATTEKNHERLNTAIKSLMNLMRKITTISKDGTWTNNTMLAMFRNSENMVILKEARKYVEMAIGGSGGIKMENSDTMKNLDVKIKEMLSTIKSAKLNPLVKKNTKESEAAKKISLLAGEIVGLEGSLGFLKDVPVKDRPKKKGEEAASTEETTTESAVMDFDEYMVMMEGAAIDGSIPNYMKNRIALSDKLNTGTSPAELPEGVPQNPIPDLTDSIDTKLKTPSDDMNDVLGSGYEAPNKKDEGKIVVNITNNYTNSFNKDSNNTTTNTKDDHSTGKVTNVTNTNSNNETSTNSHNDSSKNKDESSNKRTNSSNKKTSSSKSTKTDNSGSNNNNNSSTSADVDSKEKKFSNGKTVQEMFLFLESKEPRSDRSDAGKPPKEDLLTKAMDRDRELLPKQQKAKKGTTKALNTGKAVLKPISRTKQWLTNIVDSVIKRDEDAVKAEMLDNPSYRSSVYKAARIATKLGLTGVLYALNPYLGVGYAGVQGLKAIDKHRLKKEVGQELLTELEITEQKIKDLSGINTPEAMKQKYELMRIREKLINKIPDTHKSFIKRPSEIA